MTDRMVLVGLLLAASALIGCIKPVTREPVVQDLVLNPVLKGECREEAQTAAVLTAREAKNRDVVYSDTFNRCMRRGRPDHR